DFHVTGVQTCALPISAKDALVAAQAVGEAVNFARDLINTPPADLPPAEFVDRVKPAIKGRGLQIEVWDEKALAKDGYGGILGVEIGRASCRERGECRG